MMTSELNELKKVGLAQEDTLQEASTKLDTLSSIDSKIVICDTGNISGSVSVDNFPTEYPLPSTQVTDLKNVTIVGSNIAYDSVNDVLKVSGDVTVTNTPLDVNVTNTSLTISGTVSVDNFPSEYPLPDTQISDLKNVTVTNTPLDVNVTNTSLTVTGDVTIVGSNIAYDSTNDVLKVSINVDNVGLAKESTLSSIDSKIVKCDTDSVTVVSEKAYDSTADLKKVSIERDNVGLATESTLSSINTKVATESTLSGIKSQTDKLTFDASNNLKVDISASDVTLDVNVTNSSITVNDGGGSLTVDGTVSVGNFPSWFTSSTRTTDDISTKLGELKQFFGHVYTQSSGYGATINPANYDSTVWSDSSEYSTTSTSYTTITRVNLGHTHFMHLGFAYQFHGDGSNTVYMRFRDRNGNVLGEGSTTSATYVTNWRRGATFYSGYPDSDWMYFEGKVSGGTGYFKSFVVRAPFQNNNVIFGWNYGYKDQHTIYPIRVDSSGYQYTVAKTFDYIKSHKVYYTPSKRYVSSGSSDTLTIYSGGGVLKQIVIYVERFKPDNVTIEILDGGTVIYSITGGKLMGVIHGGYPPTGPTSSPYCGCFKWDDSNFVYYGYRVVNTVHSSSIKIRLKNNASDYIYWMVEAIYVPL